MIDHLWVAIDSEPAFKIFAEDVEHLGTKTMDDWWESFPRFRDLPNELPSMRRERWQREYVALGASQKKWLIDGACYIYLMGMKGNSIKERQWLISGAFTELANRLVGSRDVYTLQSLTSTHPVRADNSLDMRVDYAIAGLAKVHRMYISPLSPSEQLQ